jgi:hypothetical protein
MYERRNRRWLFKTPRHHGGHHQQTRPGKKHSDNLECQLTLCTFETRRNYVNQQRRRKYAQQHKQRNDECQHGSDGAGNAIRLSPVAPREQRGIDRDK